MAAAVYTIMKYTGACIRRALLIALLCVSCATLRDTPLADLPKDAGYSIVIQRVDDPRLPSLSESEFQDMLERLRNYIEEYLGYRVSFFVKGNIAMRDFQARMRFIDTLPEMGDLKKNLLDTANPADHARLRNYIGGLINATDERILSAYVPNYRSHRNKAQLRDSLYTQYIEKLLKIQHMPTGDVTPLDSPEYAETLTYPFWDASLKYLTGAHFVFTNTIMADMEVDIPIYVALRYGITTGMVEGNVSNEYRAAGVLFTLPFLSHDPFFEEERGEAIPPEKLTDVIALYATHEFGHFLNHYRDYYDHSNCIMVPANDLNYFRWYRERKESKCPRVHETLKNF